MCRLDFVVSCVVAGIGVVVHIGSLEFDTAEVVFRLGLGKDFGKAPRSQGEHPAYGEDHGDPAFSRHINGKNALYEG